MMDPSGHSAENEVGRGKHGGREIRDGAIATSRRAEAKQGSLDGVKGRQPRAILEVASRERGGGLTKGICLDGRRDSNMMVGLWLQKL